MSVTVDGIEEARKVLEEIVNSLPGISRASLTKVGSATLDLVAARTPVKTGHYVSNHQMEVTSDFAMRLFNPVHYGPFLEFGTSKMMPRPHWRPAIEHLKRHFPALFARMASGLVNDAIIGNGP